MYVLHTDICRTYIFKKYKTVLKSTKLCYKKYKLYKNGSCIIWHFHIQCTGVPISPHLHQNLLLSGVLKIIVAVLMGIMWYLMVVLICTYLMISCEHLFIRLLAICVSSLQKCLFQTFAHFLIRLFIFSLLNCRSYLDTPYINTLSVT